jgi:hypothetical protein
MAFSLQIPFICAAGTLASDRRKRLIVRRDSPGADMMFDMTGELDSPGWAGFVDIDTLLPSFLALVLAIFLGAVIAFHPTTARTVDTREEAELPKVLIMYALVGAVVGGIVHAHPVVGFVIFGLGGLMRFRTESPSTRDTGRLIIVTVIGLIAGLDFPHFAVMATAFAWILIFVFDGSPVCQLEVHEIPKGQVKAAAEAYRTALIELGCKIISEDKSFTKGRIDYVIRTPRDKNHAALHTALHERIPTEVRGEMDWEVE